MSGMGAFAREGFVAWLVGDGAKAEEAIAIAGGRVGARIGWAEVLPDAPTAAVLVVEAAGVEAEVLADVLAGLAAVAEAREMALVATFAPEQIDLVAGLLLDTGAVLLCDPTLAERAAALAIAGGGRGASAWVREDAVERLHRLNAEVARIAALLAGLVEESGDDEQVADRRRRYATGGAEEVAIAAGDIRQVIRARRLRAQFVDPRLVEDPGWDILLDLFAAELERGRVSVSSLCIASGVAPTTALRWISRMVDAGLLVRMADAGDKRRAFLALTPTASTAMRGYVGAARRAGLPLA